MFYEPSGAYTGEICGSMIRDCGAKYVILGHSERRHILGESNELVHKKTVAALNQDLIPIVCVGEKLEEREAAKTQDVIRSQIDGSLGGLDSSQLARVVVAYEPVWAIGTGQVATPAQAEEVHGDLRKLLEDRYDKDTARRVLLLYGGSVKPENAQDLLGLPNVDGALVGGASLDAESFLAIAQGYKQR